MQPLVGERVKRRGENLGMVVLEPPRTLLQIPPSFRLANPGPAWLTLIPTRNLLTLGYEYIGFRRQFCYV